MNALEQDAAQARAEHFQEVSLQAVELLAKAQRAADEAVAEAQSYARDLEQSAREQYQQILVRAQAAAQQLASAEASAPGTGQARAGEAPGPLDAQKLTYVRTYARVAHAQLKSVLAALNDELDQLAAMAEGPADTASRPSPRGPSTVPRPAVGPQTPPSAPPASTGPLARTNTQWPGENDGSGTGGGGAPAGHLSTDDGSWPPIFAATNAISYIYRDSSFEGPHF